MITAVGGLLFTGISTYYSAQVSKDQLDQSQEDSEARARKQADLVSAWSYREKSGGSTGVISNRSKDPVTSVNIVITVIPGPRLKGSSPFERPYVLQIATVGPCSKITFPAKMVRDELGRSWTPDTEMRVDMIWFSDAHGSRWTHRTTSYPALLKKHPELSGFDELRNAYRSPLQVQVANAETVPGC
ncbi:hypothetical protein [Streptomyces sp. NPDC051776]|uniref:hypothetical protein n=1 Tax=Streptomyces sp. NPDC051776 TaxID=3155414 RepID=UPI00343294E0